MGVGCTRTDVRKKIGGNKFRINIKFASNEKMLIDDDDPEVEVKDLKIDIFGEGIYEYIR